ncbi:MAG: hypothetical protein FWD67_06850 [Betaproteobacteria bacterium]|nr:hypothetical protein [Betaproteobacteria bacterium]
MGWIFRRITKEQLVFQLCCRVMTEQFLRETIAHVETPTALWRVVVTTARQGCWLGLRPGESRRTIVCDEIRRNEDTGELGFRSFSESEEPPLYSCPLHFFDMVPESLFTIFILT